MSSAQRMDPSVTECVWFGMPMVIAVRLAAAPRVSPRSGLGGTAPASAVRLGRLRLSCRLYFRLIRVRSPTFAYHRVKFPTQVKDSGD